MYRAYQHIIIVSYSPISSRRPDSLSRQTELSQAETGDTMPAGDPSLPSEARSTSALDYVTVTVIVIGGLITIAGNIVLLCHRKYRPIKSKDVTLTVLSSVGGLICILAALVANNHFPRRPHSIFAVCSLWTFWLLICFGFALWLNCLIMRLVILHRIFILRRDRLKYPYLIVFLPLMVPAIIFCIAATVKHGIKFINQKGKGDCKFQGEGLGWAYGLIGLFVIYFLIFIGLSFKLRNAIAQYNEFRLIRRGGIISLFLFLLSLVTFETKNYDKDVGRCFLSAAIASTIFYYFWARNAEVIYNSLFHRDEYGKKFVEDLKRTLSEHEREKIPDTFRSMEARLQTVRDEIEQHDGIIRELENEINVLEMECDALQQKASLLQSSPARDSSPMRNSSSEIRPV